MAPHSGVMVVYVPPLPGTPWTVTTGVAGYCRNTGSETAPAAPTTPGMSAVTAVFWMYFGTILKISLWEVVPGPDVVPLEQPESNGYATVAPAAATAAVRRPRRDMGNEEPAEVGVFSRSMFETLRVYGCGKRAVRDHAWITVGYQWREVNARY